MLQEWELLPEKEKRKKTQTKTKQGSSDKGWSEVYECSEWKIFLTAVTPFAVTPTAVMLLEFTWIYQNLT